MGSVKASVILLAEDDDNDVFFMERAFKQLRITSPLHRARDGEEAIAYLRGDGPYHDREKFPPPSLLLLDLKMPRRNGFEVLEWVRAQPGLKNLPIVVLTSSKEASDSQRAQKLGVNAYLVKPVKFEGLVELIKQLNPQWLARAEKPGGKTRSLPRSGGAAAPRSSSNST